MPSKKSNKAKAKGSNSRRQKQKAARRAERESTLSDAASNQSSPGLVPDIHISSPDLEVKLLETLKNSEVVLERLPNASSVG
ncbi:uncharacterized protein DFL_004347 [Arthrobotrys flagrans]|uniref:Uncharacterized protein n=1 Tax=Arthrobotrys flagrans TaxID=97331 RepID=A0A437A4L6_ARTFL|nr:hypothetical protein DFL_004347 [Arthrobotrys flagrans]